MADGIITLGVPYANAFQLTAETFIGAAKMMLETGKHPSILRDEVCIFDLYFKKILLYILFYSKNSFRSRCAHSANRQ